ncbi:uncharacterized protein LOC135839390 [Planococcus citri]|uniref:uncharacterized protein LOC135839390 n=1 Tax=Planococcus citri TaxID=170843 RepID=UPI0031F7AFE0
MPESKQQTSSYRKHEQFLSRSYSSKEEFAQKYKKLYYEKAHAKELYLLVLTGLEKAILKGDISTFEHLSRLIDYISDMESAAALKNFYNDAANPIKATNLVILVCKHKRVDILKYIFGDGRLLENLAVNSGKDFIAPDDTDGTCHNAFYYAVLSRDVELLDTLIHKWPGNHFTSRSEKLDEILSWAYDELRLKNVSLSEDIEIFIESVLMDLRFFSNNSGQMISISTNDDIRERVNMVLENIVFLKSEFSNRKSVDEKCLFVLRFIAQNIHVLKRQLKLTYDRLPWEEIEFCLAAFISSHVKQQDINLFYRAILHENKILRYLENFAKKLEDEKKIIEIKTIAKLAEIPNMKRDMVVAEIIRNNPEFEELYVDYQCIRDITSLEEMRDYSDMAVSTNPKEREGQLIITRALQVFGACLKNTLESPKLSTTISELLLLSLPQNTRKIVTDLCNSLSHADLLFKKTGVGEPDANYFINVQDDIKKIVHLTRTILFNRKIKIILTVLMKNIIECKCAEDSQEVVKVLRNIEYDKMILDNIKIIERGTLEELTSELSDTIIHKTNYENVLFRVIDKGQTSANSILGNTSTCYKSLFWFLKEFPVITNIKSSNKHFTNLMKSAAKHVLRELFPKAGFDLYLQGIVKSLPNIFHSARSRVQGEKLDKISRLIFEIFYFAEIHIENWNWTDELLRELVGNCSFSSLFKPTNIHSDTEDNTNTLLVYLSELKTILQKNSVDSTSVKKLISYNSNKKLQAIVEMLVLDIISILGESKKSYLGNNLFFVDDNAPSFTSKSLIDRLIHGEIVLDVLISDLSNAVILNAKKLTTEHIMKSNKDGKFIRDDHSRLKEKYNRGLITIANQNKMFTALKEGNLEDVKRYLRNGADINARDINLWTALHFAADGPSLEIVKFIIDQNCDINVKDLSGQSPLHIAAANGRNNILEFFVNKVGIPVDDLDIHHKTPLHIAAKNGNKDIVTILLKYNADATSKDTIGCTSLKYAIYHNHIDIVNILLKRGAYSDIKDDCGLTPLHAATECGRLELVKLLLSNKANPNAGLDTSVGSPLHLAADYDDHLEVAVTLISKGAHVNCKNINGITPLYFAVVCGQQEITKILLKHGANVDIVEQNSKTVLHVAAYKGREEIVEILLRNKAGTNIVDFLGSTPLHFAAKKGNLKIVTCLLKHGANIHAKNVHLSTALHFAAESGHKEIVDLLIQNGAKINTKNERYFTPLSIASAKGHSDVVRVLIQNNAKIEDRDRIGDTPLYKAVRNGHIGVIDILIKHRADVNAKTHDGHTPLHVICMHHRVLKDHRNIAARLIKNKAEVNARDDHGRTPLHYAALFGDEDVVRLLIVNRAKIDAVDSSGYTPLHVAAEAGHKEVIKILIENGANIEANLMLNGVKPLHLAVAFNHKEIVEVLLDKGAIDILLNRGDSVGMRYLLIEVAAEVGKHEVILQTLMRGELDLSDDDTILHIAASCKSGLEIVKYLVKMGCNIRTKSAFGLKPMHIAASKGFEDIVEFFLSEGLDVNDLADYNYTLLHYAAIGNHVAVAKCVIEHGVQVNAKDFLGRTAMHLAVNFCDKDFAIVLLKNGAVYNAIDNAGWKPLDMRNVPVYFHNPDYLAELVAGKPIKDVANILDLIEKLFVAVKQKSLPEVKKYIKLGAFVNAKNADVETTPLHYAAWKGCDKIVDVLLQNKANPNAVCSKGFTPLHYAAKFSHLKTVEVLLHHGAVYNATSNSGKTPLHFTKDDNIISLLTAVDEAFEKVKNGNVQVVNDLKNVKDGDSLKAIINAHNRENKTLIDAAQRSNLQLIRKLAEIKFQRYSN